MRIEVGCYMRFKEEFLKELLRRLKENIDIVESSFELSDIPFDEKKIFKIEPIEYHLTLLVDSDPYDFVNKLVYCIVNKQEVKVSTRNIACDLLFNMINLILDEFTVERIGRIGD